MHDRSEEHSELPFETEYFISPIDAIPDLVPVVNYSDDLGVLALAVATCTAYITPEVKAQAKKDLWDPVFGGA